MAVDITLKIDGVEGESRIRGYEGEIDVIHWSWSITNTSDMHLGMGGGSGRADVDTLHIHKYVDKSTPNLMRSCLTGKHFESAELSIRKSGGDEPVKFLRLVMKPVMVTSISSGGSGGDDRIEESITLSFANFEIYYTPQRDDGSADSPLDLMWSIEQNAEQ